MAPGVPEVSGRSPGHPRAPARVDARSPALREGSGNSAGQERAGDGNRVDSPGVNDRSRCPPRPSGRGADRGALVEGPMSRIGKNTVPIPSGVSITVQGASVAVKEPKGELKRLVHPEMNVAVE